MKDKLFIQALLLDPGFFIYMTALFNVAMRLVLGVIYEFYYRGKIKRIFSKFVEIVE